MFFIDAKYDVLCAQSELKSSLAIAQVLRFFLIDWVTRIFLVLAARVN